MTAIEEDRQAEDGSGAPFTDGRITPEAAARLLFQDPRAIVGFVASEPEEAKRAVEELVRLFETIPGVIKGAFEGARAGAETLSGDRLQGLAEIIQNADDAGASYVRFQVVGDHFVAVHDGEDVTLSDVLALATPWLSNKTENDASTGRFGIGLMTLRALSDVLDVHSGPYHVRLGDPAIAAIDCGDLPFELPELGITALCLPLRSGVLGTDDVASWLERWDDSACFCVTFARSLSLTRAVRQFARSTSRGTTTNPPAARWRARSSPCGGDTPQRPMVVDAGPLGRRGETF